MAPVDCCKAGRATRLFPFEPLTVSAASLVLVLLVSQALSTSPVASPVAAPRLCAKLGPAASATWMTASRTCLGFYPKGAPIQVPDDSNTTIWGQLQQGFQDITFIDRHGNEYPVTKPPPSPSDDDGRAWKLIIMQATLKRGNVTKLKPVLYVPFSTVMSTMVNTSFEGQLANARPRPAGPNATSWFKWTFSSKITVGSPTDKYGTLLHGSFINLFHDAVDAHGRCRPALCSDPTRKSAACRYYTSFFGNSTAVTLNWDPSMHAPGDTELVPLFPATHRQYMASFNELYQMLQPDFWFVPRNYSFYAHGTPLGIPLSFTGTLVKSKTPTAKLC